MAHDSVVPRALSLDDLLRLKSIGDVQMSPSGSQVAFVLSHGFKPHDEPAQSRVWLLDLPVGSSRQLTGGPRADVAPRWSPDGRRLAFTSDRADKGRAQLYVLDPAGGEAQRVCETTTRVSQPAWSPDGRLLSFIAADPDTEEEKKRKEAHEDWLVVGANPKFDRLCIADLADHSWRCVTQGTGHIWEYDWSPDGSELVVLVAPRPTDDGWFEAGLALVPVAGGVPQPLLSLPGKQMAVPRWSPDGRRIAFIGCTWSDPGIVGGDIYVLDRAGGAPRCLTAGQPLSVTWLQWANDSSAIHFLAHGHGKLVLGEATVAAEPVIRPYWAEPIACSERLQPRFSTDRSGSRFAFAREDPRRPRDIWIWSAAAGWSQHSNLHADLASAAVGPTEPVRWESHDGRAIAGLLIRPADAALRPPFPLFVHVHGGPAHCWPHRFCAGWHDWGQWLAAHGYAVFLPNYRGSFGWGTEFTGANLGDMGGGDLQDILTGVDELVTRGVADPTRLAIGGWSYGGFLSAWAITQTDRFRAAIVGAAITHWLSFHGTSEIPAWDELFWRESPYQRGGKYQQFSPVTQVWGSSTPTLILHGGDDSCVPVTQSYELYRALQAMKVDTELVVYPRAGHSIGELPHQRDLLRRVLGWLDRHLKH